MNESIKPVANGGAADDLIILIKQLIKEKQYEGVALLFTSNKEAYRNLHILPTIAMDIFHDVCLGNLTEKVHQDESSLYNCVEELLKVVAYNATTEELLLELLELIEDNKSECVFISALKALQIVLLRQGGKKPRALEWSLVSVYTRLADLPVPDFLKDGYDDNERRLLELDDQIQSLLMHYLTVGLFYDPLITDVCSQTRKDTEVFRPVGITRRNVLFCFLIQLLGKPLSLLDMSNDEESKTNTYTLQCAKSLTQGATKCISDPLFILSFVEYRVRFERRKDEVKGVLERSSSNIFLIDEKLPMYCLAVYYYMLFVEKIDSEHIPLVYHPLYILESCLYLIYELLVQEEPPLAGKAILLMQKLLNNLQHNLISVSSLELEIHKSTFLALCNLVGFSAHTQLRQIGLKVMRQYINSFEDEGRFLIIKNLLKTVNHHGIAGYLVTLYKDLIADALKNFVNLPPYFCGNDFHHLAFNNIWQLPHGIETDLLDSSDKIISSLNALCYIALRDVENRTGFWNFVPELQLTYLTDLRKGLDFSLAHFKAELRSVELGVERAQLDKLSLLDIDVANDKQSKFNLKLDREQKINILNQNLCTFELILSLLARAHECLENTPTPQSIASKINC